MSWYKEQAEKKIMEFSALRPSTIPRAILTNKLNREIPVTITVTNLNTPADAESLSQALQEMEGIVRVEPIIHQKKLVILYNLGLISLNSITYKISSLGYHYVQRG